MSTTTEPAVQEESSILPSNAIPVGERVKTRHSTRSKVQQPNPPQQPPQRSMVDLQQQGGFLQVPQQHSPQTSQTSHDMMMKGRDEAAAALSGLTPYMASPGVSFSPWMMPVDGSFRISPMAQMMPMNGRPAVIYTHNYERNKFETSFLQQITPDGEGPRVPQHNPAPPPPAMPQRPQRSSARNHHGDAAMMAVNRLVTNPRNAEASSSVKKSAKGMAGKSLAKLSPKKNKSRYNVDEDERKEKRREQNRRNAAKCRQRKIDKVTELSVMLSGLRDENQHLRRSHEELEHKMRQLSAKSISV